MPPLPLTAVIVIHHSHLRNLESCLDSLPPSDYLTVVVVDTSIHSEARDICLQHKVGYVPAKRNGGYAWALSVGVRTIDESIEVIVASNSDVLFTPGSIAALALCARQSDGVSYPVQTDFLGNIAPYSVHPQLSAGEAAARWLGFGRARFLRRTQTVIANAVDASTPIRLPKSTSGSGAAFAMSVSSWRITGGLNPRFFLFEEDRAFGSSLQRAGIPSWLCGNAYVVHEGGFASRGISPEATAECAISEELYWNEHLGHALFWIRRLQDLGLLLRVSGFALLGRVGRAKRYWAAFSLIRHLRRNGRASLFGPDGVRVSVREAAH